MFLRCSSVWFPAVKGVVFPFSFSWCRSGALGRGPAPARLGSVPGTPGICVSCELCTVAPGRSRGWRTEGSPRGLRARCRRYLLLSYCRYLFCTVSAAFVRDNKPLQQPPPARPWGAARHQGALPRGGRCRKRRAGALTGRRKRWSRARQRRRRRGGSGAMAAGGSLSRSERKAAARAEILQQEEQRDRRRQVRYDAARPVPPPRDGPP